MSSEPYLQFYDFLQYDGTNGAAVAALGNQQVVSDNGTTLVISPTGLPQDATFTFQVGDWYSPTIGLWSPIDFPNYFMDPTTLAGTDTVGTMDGKSVAVPILLLGASVDRVITWDTPFADTSYKVRFLPDANTIGRITPVVKSGTKTVNGLTVTISAGLAVTVAGVLHVLGTT